MPVTKIFDIETTLPSVGRHGLVELAPAALARGAAQVKCGNVCS
jgi:hypothetical protein